MLNRNSDGIACISVANTQIKGFDPIEFESMLTSVSEQFKLNEGRLKFTKELPQNNITQFLVVSLLLQEYHVRWQFSPTSSQPLLQFSSKQSVTLLIEVAMPCLKSCMHKMSTIFDVQVK